MRGSFQYFTVAEAERTTSEGVPSGRRSRADVLVALARYAAADSRPTQLSINGQVIKQDALKDVTGSWNPDTQRWHVEGTYEFNPGVNVVRLSRRPPLPPARS